MNPVQINLTLAWLWVVLGFVSGLHLGLHFHQPDWLGGYSSLKRRLYRLCHISFFGTALVNLMFFFTARQFGESGWTVTLASWGFVLGAVAMPACCLMMAHFPNTRMLFAVPVISLAGAGALTLWEVVRS